MLEISVYPPGLGEISGSPFSAKILCLLEMSGQEYVRKNQPDPRKTPKGKYPVLNHQGNIVPDSDQIRDYLENTFGLDFDEGLTREQRGISRSVIRMVEENVYFAIVSNRWQNEIHWRVIKEEFFAGIPMLLRGFIANKVRKGVINQVVSQGMGRHTDQERLERVKKDLDAVTAILGDKTFLFGPKPTAADASVVAMLRALAFFPLENDLSNLMLNNPALMAYVERGKAKIYPK